MISATEDRLDRIETKLDDLGQVVVKLARVEEKLASIELGRNEYNARLKDVLEEMKDIRKNQAQEIRELRSLIGDMGLKINQNSRITDMLVKFTWIIVTAVVGSIGYLLTNK